ncbi:hypothetical protein FB451DRAFT_1374729 [Mycena latifolia]|nr:hypothetical protein FB451DRAFT_1374729 [Mycena latifolia]
MFSLPCVVLLARIVLAVSCDVANNHSPPARRVQQYWELLQDRRAELFKRGYFAVPSRKGAVIVSDAALSGKIAVKVDHAVPRGNRADFWVPAGLLTVRSDYCAVDENVRRVRSPDRHAIAIRDNPRCRDGGSTPTTTATHKTTTATTATTETATAAQGTTTTTNDPGNTHSTPAPARPSAPTAPAGSQNVIVDVSSDASISWTGAWFVVASTCTSGSQAKSMSGNSSIIVSGTMIYSFEDLRGEENRRWHLTVLREYDEVTEAVPPSSTWSCYNAYLSGNPSEAHQSRARSSSSYLATLASSSFSAPSSTTSTSPVPHNARTAHPMTITDQPRRPLVASTVQRPHSVAQCRRDNALIRENRARARAELVRPKNMADGKVEPAIENSGGAAESMHCFRDGTPLFCYQQLERTSRRRRFPRDVLLRLAKRSTLSGVTATVEPNTFLVVPGLGEGCFEAKYSNSCGVSGKEDKIFTNFYPPYFPPTSLIMSLTKGLHFARQKALFNVFMPASTLLHTDLFGPQRRPWKFWDMHVPEVAEEPPRNRRQPFRSTRSGNASVIFVGKQPIRPPSSDGLRGRLLPSAYYLYDAGTKDVYRFGQEEHIAVSAEGFIACADWNNMAHLGSLGSVPFPLKQTHLIPGPPLRLHDLPNAKVFSLSAKLFT